MSARLWRACRAWRRPRVATPRWHSGKWMARALLFLMPLTEACLLTEPFQMEPSEPSKQSRPPRIVESTVSPEGHLVTLGTAAIGTKDECAQTFTIARVVEEETAAEVHARLFIDYDPNKTLTAVRDQKLLPNETEPTSRLNLSFPVKASDFGRDATKATHLVEIVISDGFADIAVYPPFRALQPAHESVSYAWFVTADPTLSCPAP